MSLHSLRFVFRFLAMTVSIMIAYVGAWAAIDVRWYINLQAVHAFDAQAGSPVVLDVDRIIHRGFVGGYRVEVREVAPPRSFCTTGDVELTYRVEAQLPDVVTLAFWATGNGCSNKIDRGIPPGRYYVHTCHFVRFSVFFPRRERCEDSNPFEVFAAP